MLRSFKIVTVKSGIVAEVVVQAFTIDQAKDMGLRLTGGDHVMGVHYL